MSEVISELFRAEALAARQMRVDGDILLVQPTSVRVGAIGLVVLVAAFAIPVVGGKFARSESVRGWLVTDKGTAQIIAPHPGIVVSLSVSDGDTVKQGTPLAKINIDQEYTEGVRAHDEELAALNVQKGLAEQQIDAIKASEKSRRSALDGQIISIARRKSQIIDQIELEEKIVSSMNGIIERYRPIAEKGFITKTEMDRREQDLLAAQQQLLRLQEERESAEGDLEKANSDLSDLKSQTITSTANVHTAIAGFSIQRSQLQDAHSYILTAPVSGTITGLQTNTGETVDPNRPLMLIVPIGSKLHADLYAPSRAIGFMKPGQEVRLLYDAYPYQRFGSYGGNVRSISRTSLNPQQVDASFKSDEPVYRISVSLGQQAVIAYGERLKLQPGMSLTGKVIIEKQSFASWLLSPIYAVMKRD